MKTSFRTKQGRAREKQCSITHASFWQTGRKLHSTAGAHGPHGAVDLHHALGLHSKQKNESAQQNTQVNQQTHWLNQACTIAATTMLVLHAPAALAMSDGGSQWTPSSLYATSAAPALTEQGQPWPAHLQAPALQGAPQDGSVDLNSSRPLQGVSSLQGPLQGTQEVVQRWSAPVVSDLASYSDDDGNTVWLQLGVVLAVNFFALKAVQEVMRRTADKNEPVTLVRLQLGLVPQPGAQLWGGTPLTLLRGRLAQLEGMQQAGQQGQWLIAEEAALQLAGQQAATALADLVVVHLSSKSEAYSLFGQLAAHEGDKARAEERLAHAKGQGVCVEDWADPGPPAILPGTQGRGSRSAVAQSLFKWFQSGSEDEENEDPSGCDDALVVTLVVAARGNLVLPSELHTWFDVCSVLKVVCGLSSQQLMAVDVSWAPREDGTYITQDVLLQEYSNLRPLAT